MRYTVAFLAAAACAAAAPQRPHVVMFVIDDLGWADVGYKNGTGLEPATPFLNSLTKEAVQMGSYYTQPVCSPTRSCFMQGRYPFHQGLQHYNTIMPASLAAMPLDQPTLPELLLKLNYTTHAVGKWHLGYASWKNTPLERGFNSYKGYMQGEIDYYNKTFQVPKKFLPWPTIIGKDWWVNKTADKNDLAYSKYAYDDEFTRVLDTYDVSQQEEHPLFLYFANQLAHVPLEVPDTYLSVCQAITDAKRKTYCGMLSAVDDSLNKVVTTLKAKNMWDKTLLIVTTDNGGMPNVPGSFPPSAGSNFPLRAGKGTVFQGGVRSIGMVAGGVVPAAVRGTTVGEKGVGSEMTHAVDWLPTVLTLVGGESLIPANVDGEDIWAVLTQKAAVKRTSVPLNINMHIGYPDGGHQVGLVSTDGWKIIMSNVTGPVFHYDGWYPVPPAKIIPAPPTTTPGLFLFNLNDDPNEHTNLFATNPEMVQKLNGTLNEWMKTYMPPQANMLDPLGLPELHGGVWAPFSTK